MTTFIIRRLTQTIIVLFIVSIVVFLLLHIMPGDPVEIMLGINATPEKVLALRQALKLDRPLTVQYLSWFGNLFQGDFGDSIFYTQKVTTLIGDRIPITLHIGLLGFIISNLMGIPIGIICAIRRGTFIDLVLTTTANIGLGIPSFFLGILGIYLFGLKLRLLPIQGYTSPLSDFWLSTRQLIMPVFCIAVFPIAGIARQTRSAMLEVIQQDYIRTAWAKGLKEQTVIMKHALKNSLIPVVTLSSLQLATIIGGTVFVETIFNIPGMGRLLVSSIMNHDFIIAQAIILLIGISIAFVNLFIDIFYSWLDPRIRY